MGQWLGTPTLGVSNATETCSQAACFLSQTQRDMHVEKPASAPWENAAAAAAAAGPAVDRVEGLSTQGEATAKS